MQSESSTTLPPRIPDHVLLRRIGRGSYGEVWLGRNVFGGFRAIKLILAQTEDQARHLEREFEGIKKFEPVSRSHEGFVDVLHGGQDPVHRVFYYVMELGDDCVSGQEISPETYSPKTLGSEVRARGRLAVADCIRYGLVLCDALVQLHEKGLMHRDIKPGNIIFVNGTPKLADIGLVTEVGEANSYVGTDGFIPPEGPTSVQADVYALGKVLYEMSTGRDRKEFPTIPLDVDRFPDAAAFLELNEVILRACHAERPRRYASAASLREDLAVLHHGKSIKRLRWLERRWMSVQRAAIVAGVLCVLTALVGFPFFQHHRLAREARLRQIGKLVADSSHLVDQGDLAGALPLAGVALRLDMGDRHRERLHRLRLHSILEQTPSLADLRIQSKRVNSVDWSADGKRLLIGEWNGKAAIWDRKTQRTSQPFGPGSGLQMARFSPDGNWVATASFDQTARLYQAATQELVYRLPHPKGVYSARFSNDSQRLVTGCDDGSARVYDVPSGNLRLEIRGHSSGVQNAAFSPDDQLIVTTGRDGLVRLWDAHNGEPAGAPLDHGGWVYDAAFSPDRALLVTACSDKLARVWDLKLRRMIYPPLRHGEGVRTCAFSADGARILTASTDSNVRIWNAVTLQPERPASVLRHAAHVLDVALASDGHTLASCTSEGAVYVWDLAATAIVPRTADGHYNSRGDLRVTVSSNSLSLIDTYTGLPRAARFPLDFVPDVVAVSDNGETVAMMAGRFEGAPQTLASLERARLRSFTMPGTNRFERLILNRDGSHVIALGRARLALYDIQQQIRLFELAPDTADIVDASFHPARQSVLIVHSKHVEIRSFSGERGFPAIRLSGTAQQARFSPDGSRFATACSDSYFTQHAAQMYDAANGQPLGPPLKHGDGVLAVAFSQDNRRIVTCGEDFDAIVWDVATGRQLFAPLKHTEQVAGAAFSQDGRWIATACANGTLRLWDADTGDAITPPIPYPGTLKTVRFVLGDRSVLLTDNEGASWMYELASSLPSNDMEIYARLLSGGLSTATAENTGMLASWNMLSERYASLLRPDRNEVLAWHRERARTLGKAGNAAGAAFHELRARSTP